jgi:acyl dehydratase
MSLPTTPLPQDKRYYWEDFPAGHSRDFGGMTVQRDAVLAFARQFDPQPFHVDEEAARASLFGGLCASGWHTCAMAMRMMCDAYLLDSASLGSPGIDALRWLRPVYPDDVLRMRMTVLAARPMASKPHVGLVQSRWDVSNQHGDMVLTMEGWGMFRRREAPAVEPAPAAGRSA